MLDSPKGQESKYGRRRVEETSWPPFVSLAKRLWQTELPEKSSRKLGVRLTPIISALTEAEAGESKV